MILANQDANIPSEYYHDPELQNSFGDTVAIIYARRNIKIPKEWQHTPELQNNDQYTVALYQARNGLIPDKEWEHEKLLRAKYFRFKNIAPFRMKRCMPVKQLRWFTVQNFLQSHNIEVPEQWKYDVVDEDDNSEAMEQAQEGLIPDEQYQHDPFQANLNGETVATILSQQGIIPSPNWSYDVNLSGYYKPSIKENLINNGFVYKNNKFIKNYEIITKTDTCVICLSEEQQFIKSKCNHNICLNCFLQLLKGRNEKECPICKMKNWWCIYDIFDEEQSQDLNEQNNNANIQQQNQIE